MGNTLVLGLAALCACTALPGVGDDTTTTTGPDGGTTTTTTAHGRYFEQAMFFDQEVSGVAKAATSDATITALRAEGGWGNGDKFQIDFSIDVLTADSSTPMKQFTPTDDFYSPDCDQMPMPVPANGHVEGEDGYACTGDGDCHLLVFDKGAHTLYEMWRANLAGSSFQGGCLAAWDTARSYTNTLRGDQCSSADAAGLPMAPLLFTADEVAAGSIDHAIRFILPNDRVTRGYVRPAVHATRTTGAGAAPAYGVHLRLKPGFDIDSLPTEGAKVVARALQKYGMYHADGGQIALTAQSDVGTTAKWDGLLGPRDLASLKVEDFEVIDHGAMIDLTFDCTR